MSTYIEADAWVLTVIRVEQQCCNKRKQSSPQCSPSSKINSGY